MKLSFYSMNSALLYISSVLFSFSLNAAAPQWQINAANSKVIFTAIQNNAPLTGEFKNIMGQIYFDPKHLEQSSGKIEIGMNSIVLSFKELEAILKAPEWFNASLFPTATFTIKEVKEHEKNIFEAIGILQLRDKTVSTDISFTVRNYNEQKIEAIGSFVVKRTEFGVGQGEWADTADIKDEVKVDFNIELTP